MDVMKKKVQAGKPINRRSLLTGAVGAVAVSTLPKPAIAKGLHEWKMVMTWQKVLPGLGTGAVRLGKRITALTEGRINVKIYGSGELVPPLQVFDAVASGTAEIGHGAPYYWLNKHPSTAFFCAVPGGLTAQEQNAWLYFGGGQQLWDELYAQFGLKAFPAGNTGVQMGGWFNRELNSVDDIKGLKMRMPGLAGQVINRLGGSAQTIPAQELFTSMQSGVIDALEWVGPWNDIALGFHRVSKYYYGPGFHEGGPTLELMINKDVWDALPKDLQRIVKTACATENDVMAAEYYANNIRAFQQLKTTHNVDIRQYPKEILQALYRTSEDVVADTAKEDKMARKIYDSYSKFRKELLAMSDVTEYGFMHARKIAHDKV